MKLTNQINELQEAGVITPETALNINNYFDSKKDESSGKMMVIFSVIGSLLVGLGLILLFAHNWDSMGKISKTIVAIAPLLIAQIIGGYVLLKKPDSLGWREGIGSLIFICIGLSISLVAQVYHIYGNFPRFLLTWMLLALPLIYLLRSSMVSFLITGGITWYLIVESKLFRYIIFQPEGYSFQMEQLIGPGLFLMVMLLVINFFSGLLKREPQSNYITLASWIIPTCLTISLLAFDKRNEEVLFLTYLLLFSAFTWYGKSSKWYRRSSISNGFRVIGPLGVLVMLFMLTFEDVAEEFIYLAGHSFGLEWLSVFLIATPFTALLFKERVRFNELVKDPLNLAFIPVILVLTLSSSSILITVLFNLLVFVIALFKVITGIKDNLLGKLNAGLLIITVLVICRFFDQDMSFILRGVIFLALGTGFLLSNLWILKKKKNETK